jgi:hypothetical protein
VIINGLKGVGHGPNLNLRRVGTLGLRNTRMVARQNPCSVAQGLIVELHSREWYI